MCRISCRTSIPFPDIRCRGLHFHTQFFKMHLSFHCFLLHFYTDISCKYFQLLRVRQFKRLELEGSNELPTFPNIHTNEDWKIAPLPPRLQCQHLGLGDVSPSNPIHFITSLNSHVHGIQVDFDDGHCPTWANTIAGLHNVVAFVNGTFHPHKVPSLEKAPVLLLRPRAWNMPEHNIFVCVP